MKSGSYRTWEVMEVEGSGYRLGDNRRPVMDMLDCNYGYSRWKAWY